ncbi:hypothetical protein LE190_15635 [Massilia oculi]|uniref:Uncharacterized protein n=1 Tax=Massilia hydrophila TaxID=3044279 RepID=A0ABS7YG86_9BURK|nr:hypothetical protein [Massilia oculi]MCA1857345.1 hypothetical protein [Massilia oculi]
MRVSTPAMKLNVRIDTAARKDGELVMQGVAGMMPCETSMTPQEIRKLIRLVLSPRILPILFSRAKQ